VRTPNFLPSLVENAFASAVISKGWRKVCIWPFKQLGMLCRNPALKALCQDQINKVFAVIEKDLVPLASAQGTTTDEQIYRHLGDLLGGPIHGLSDSVRSSCNTSRETTASGASSLSDTLQISR